MITLASALNIAMVLTVVGLVSACIRLIIGPSRADRVVSLDLITVLLIAIAAQLSLMYEVAAYLDLGLAIALIGFLATVAFARYIETAPHGKTPEDEPTQVTPERSVSARSVEDRSAIETHR